jgi:hypothetical protein
MESGLALSRRECQRDFAAQQTRACRAAEYVNSPIFLPSATAAGPVARRAIDDRFYLGPVDPYVGQSPIAQGLKLLNSAPALPLPQPRSERVLQERPGSEISPAESVPGKVRRGHCAPFRSHAAAEKSARGRSRFRGHASSLVVRICAVPATRTTDAAPIGGRTRPVAPWRAERPRS